MAFRDEWVWLSWEWTNPASGCIQLELQVLLGDLGFFWFGILQLKQDNEEWRFNSRADDWGMIDCVERVDEKYPE